ncbi:MAG: GDSL-type esterase/lipase family protein [Pseudomonadota bacterium]|nr:GDSL-type esterase/lipase family protein [Pseudomonadota bacterium]
MALVGVEGSARLVEPLVVPDRTIPLPAPQSPGVASAQGFKNALEQRRRSEGLAVAMTEDESAGWALPPSTVRKEGNVTVRVNALGLRGPEVQPPAEGELRLLTLGDSSIFGVEVEEKYVFSSVAADRLREARGVPVTAYIGGVPGYDSTQSLANLRKVGPALSPTWVVIGCIWSDLYRTDDTTRGTYRREIVGPFRGLAAWRIARWQLAPWLASERVRWLDGVEDIGAFDGEGLAPRTSLAAYRRNLEAIVADTRKLGARPAFVLLPAPMDFDRTPLPVSIAAYRATMKKVADEAGAPLVDGPALFLERGSLSWFVDNVHPSREGHVLLGEALGAALVEASP